jgi:MFS family permease
LALGLNEFAGYVAVGLMSWITGFIAGQWGLRPYPFYLGIGIAVIGLAVSVLAVRETHGHVAVESSAAPALSANETPTFRQIFYVTSLGNASLFAACQAGLVNNLNDGMSWGLFPLFFAAHGLPIEQIGVVKAAYPLTWGVLQVATGPLSDRLGRRGLIAGGMIVQALGIWLTVLVADYGAWLVGAVLQGAGTAMVYPTLLAAIADHAHPLWRASSLGVYRFWRDLGYAIGALLSGIIADAVSIGAAIHVVAAITLASGLVTLVAMRAPRTVTEAHRTAEDQRTERRRT